jgi:predicted nucleotidyltransferase
VSSPDTLPDRFRELREQLVPALKPYVSRITLFGSTARGEDRPDSDIDVLLTLKAPDDRPPLGLQWFHLERTLSEHVGRRVELVTEDALSPHVRPHMDSDRVVLYEG